MTEPVIEKAAAWMYRGLWKILTDWFRVPDLPPTLPGHDAHSVRSFHPSRRYLSYLKFYFWIALALIDAAILIGWVAVFQANSSLGAMLAVPALALAVIPDIVAYIAIHLRYDTTWYVMSDRSLRCRRGLWVILEHTITFENVQNVYVTRGPVQHFFGISEIVVETAGAAEGSENNRFAGGNKAILEGIDNPQAIRELIMDRVRASKGAGLGHEPEPPRRISWSASHLAVLREILVMVQRRP